MSEEMLEVHDSTLAARDRLRNAEHSSEWDFSDEPEPLRHRIHGYPAKFPNFIVTKAITYAKEQGVTVKKIGDVFGGCGTVAYEAVRKGLDFWGCDINPVAVLIARTKSGSYCPDTINEYAKRIVSAFPSASTEARLSVEATERLKYWFQSQQFCDVAKLLNAINEVVPVASDYRGVFYCAFSAILKSTSQWKSRSSKPALDRNKKPRVVLIAFIKQCELIARAWSSEKNECQSKIEVHHANLMNVQAPSGTLDLIVTSPPYVTSYEYADLHQLSSLWLGFSSDFRDLRKGSIGSSKGEINFRKDFTALNDVGLQVVFSLYGKNKAAARAVAKYYLDMQKVAGRCFGFLSEKGIGVFVIGNTEYCNVHIDNASHLAEALICAGFSRVKVTKRRVKNKINTPFRDVGGRFSRSETQRSVYSEEYILIAHK